jgi:Do/DeqQ family serine protease
MQAMKHKLGFASIILAGFMAFSGVSAAPQAALERRVVPSSRGQLIQSYAPIVKQVAPAVVNIYTKKRIKVQTRRSPFADDPIFRQFFGDGFGGGAQERIQRALGSGVIVRPNGFIVTSNHVIAGADEITVALADRREYPAKVMLADESTDLAVLKIDTKGEALPSLALRDSDSLEVGDVVLAIGDPFGVGQTVTSGIVSALARTNVGISDYQFFIQTDAAINPGNSGGALVTMDGRLAGINTAIYSQSGGSIGIGFAIPSNMVTSVLSAALVNGRIFRPWVGAGGQEVTAEIARTMGLKRPGGVLINQLYPGGPAELAGVKVGDVILSVAANPVDSIDALRFRLRLWSGDAQKKVPLLLARDGKQLTAELTLRRAPEVPPREVTVMAEDNFFKGVKLGNLSPAFAEELKLDAFQSGVVVLGMSDNSLPGRYGLLQPRDIILKVNGRAVKTIAELKAAAAFKGLFSYRILRGDTTIECGEAHDGSFGCRE